MKPRKRKQPRASVFDWPPIETDWPPIETNWPPLELGERSAEDIEPQRIRKIRHTARARKGKK